MEEEEKKIASFLGQLLLYLLLFHIVFFLSLWYSWFYKFRSLLWAAQEVVLSLSWLFCVSFPFFVKCLQRVAMQWCFIWTVFQGSFKDVSRKFMGVSRKIEGCFEGGTLNMFKGCFKGLSTKFQGWFDKDWRVFGGSFKFFFSREF